MQLGQIFTIKMKKKLTLLKLVMKRLSWIDGEIINIPIKQIAVQS